MAIPVTDETNITGALIVAINMRRTIAQLSTSPPPAAILRTDTLVDLQAIIVRLNTYLNANL